MLPGLPRGNDTIVRASDQHHAAHTKEVLPPCCSLGGREPESAQGPGQVGGGTQRVRKAENDSQVEAWGLTSGIGMVSFPIDQGQEAAGIEVQVIMVGIWVQTAFRKIVRGAGRGGRTGDWKTHQEASVIDKVNSNVTQQQ